MSLCAVLICVSVCVTVQTVRVCRVVTVWNKFSNTYFTTAAVKQLNDWLTKCNSDRLCVSHTYVTCLHVCWDPGSCWFGLNQQSLITEIFCNLCVNRVLLNLQLDLFKGFRSSLGLEPPDQSYCCEAVHRSEWFLCLRGQRRRAGVNHEESSVLSAFITSGAPELAELCVSVMFSH